MLTVFSVSVYMKGLTSLHLVLLLFSISLPDCSATDTISVTEPLQDPNTLVSLGQTFKLGFFNPGNTSNRYVGIMYNVPDPNMRAVWVANRDMPLKDSSGVLTISEDGNLVVLNGKKEILWSSNATNPAPNSTAQLLEDGNLVLRESSNGRSVWESFQAPTDTLLPGMTIGGGRNGTIQLTSWKSYSDPSTGNYTLGVSALQVPEMLGWNDGVLIWRSGPWDGNKFIGLAGDSNLYSRGNENYYTYNSSASTAYRLSYYGVGFLMYFNKDVRWVYSTYSGSVCDLYGRCGPNAICDINVSSQCSCLKGFEPRDTREWDKRNYSGGCLRMGVLQCQRSSSAGRKVEDDDYLHLRNVKVPDSFEIIATPSEVDCGNQCFKDCSCSAYSFVVGIGCLHWNHTLIDIQQFSMNYGSDLHVRVAQYSKLDHGGSKQKNKAIVATVVSGCLFFVVSAFIFWIWRIKHRGKISETEISSEKSKLQELPLYSYESIANATNDFDAMNKLGQGGFGSVYKGKLSDGQEIAVKRLSNSSTQGMKEFMNEVTLISKLQHRNLVRLLGCCVERDEKMLVYEYMPNKSLDAYLFDSGRQDFLNWSRRYSIVEGIGRGLIYLHRDSRLRIIHRDMKASNVLLDENMNPKISDFGLARIFGGNQDQANTNRVVGTYGYMAPEYAMGGKFSEKSDVYSFGILLLEIISGKRNTSFYLDDDNLSLVGYAWKLWNENEAVKLAFTDQLDPITEMELQRCVQVGLLCVQDSPNDRPNMSNALSMLNSEVADLPLPKLPVYTDTLFSLSEDHCYVQRGRSNNNVSLTELQGR